MNTKPSSLLWTAHAAKTKQLMQVPADLTDRLSDTLSDDQWFAFIRDTRMYNLHEAVTRLPEDLFTEVVCIIAATYSWTLEDTSRPLPVGRQVGLIEAPARDVTAPRVPITPTVSWGIRKDLIVERAPQLLDSYNPTHPDPAFRRRTKLDRMIRRAVKQPHLHADIIDACVRDLHSGIRLVPADVREPLMAQIMAELAIPPAIDAYADGKPKVPRAPEQKRKDKVLVTDTHGNAWTWSCGWYRVGEDGQRLDAKPALGHSTFRRAIVPATLEQLGKTSFRHTRPWGQWRRGSGPADHPLFGSCEIIITDGVHAVIKLHDGTKKEVELENLRSIGTALPRIASSASSTASKSPRAPRTTKATENLDFLMSLLTQIPLPENH